MMMMWPLDGAARRAVAVRCCIATICTMATSGCASPDDLVGAWRSDDALTVRHLKDDADKLTPAQREAFLRPGSGYFGHMISVFRQADGFAIFEGKCQEQVRYEVAGRVFRTLYVRTHGAGEVTTRAMRMEDHDTYSVAMELAGGTREYFRRIPLSDVVRDHPCAKEFLGSGDEHAEPR
jgi:hypothetical protein